MQVCPITPHADRSVSCCSPPCAPPVTTILAPAHNLQLSLQLDPGPEAPTTYGAAVDRHAAMINLLCLRQHHGIHQLYFAVKPLSIRSERWPGVVMTRAPRIAAAAAIRD